MAPVKGRPIKRGRARAERENSSPYYSRAVAKGLEILEILGSFSEPMALNQLAARLKLSKASVFRLLFTLEETGYVRKDSDGRYVLKHDIRRSVRDKLNGKLMQVSVPHLRDLAREFRETTGLAALFENHIEVIAVVQSPQTLHMGNTVGRILQPHASSLGKCITAFQTDDRREHLLRSYGINAVTRQTLTDQNEIEQEFDRIRQSGYATDRGETCIDGHCFGAPVSGPDGEVFAAISISMPSSRLGSPEYQSRVVERIKQAAQAITQALR